MADPRLVLSDKICGAGIMPLYSDERDETMHRVIDALYEGGARTFEFTNRKPNARFVFESLVKYASQFPDLDIGVGTVMDGETAGKFIEDGARFIVSPSIQVSTANACSSRGTLWIPGAATPTEISYALELGAGIVKIFPGSVLKPEFIRSIHPVFPHVNFMVSGGVDPEEENMGEWYRAGARCLGLGSQLFSEGLIRNQQWSELTLRMSRCLDIARRLKAI